jgi:hypothetical protein
MNTKSPFVLAPVLAPDAAEAWCGVHVGLDPLSFVIVSRPRHPAARDVRLRVDRPSVTGSPT